MEEDLLKPRQLLKSGILEEYHDKDFDDFYAHSDRRSELEPKVGKWNKKYPGNRIDLDFDRGEEILEEVMTYADHLENARKLGISMFLHGTNGTGKTLLAVSTLKQALREGYTAQMTSLGGIIDLYAGGWNSKEKKIMYNERIRDVDFLLIDDIGKEYRANSTNLVEVAFDNLIRYRALRRKPFIITTNTTVDGVKNDYGQSLLSLLRGKCMFIKVNGGDYRDLILSKNVKRRLIEG